ncbi:hypothetical protein FH972_022761 [Carpinus fangiana]|uniref:Uncharacterized protein n=1 Tax=Carpinus fangiana TaxID=176857 RepID=A0A5N6KTR1_9ROSI|nr:hypothetical protein FH972_022761 [Carpinus fangiana]
MPVLLTANYTCHTVPPYWSFQKKSRDKQQATDALPSRNDHENREVICSFSPTEATEAPSFRDPSLPACASHPGSCGADASRSDLGPVACHILQVLGEVGKGAFEDLAVQRSAHDWLEIDKVLVRLVRGAQDVVGGLFDRTHKFCDFVGVFRDETLVRNVQDAAEAWRYTVRLDIPVNEECKLTAAAEFSKLVNAEHLNIVLGASLSLEPFGQLDHLDILKPDAGVDLALDDGFGDIHATSDGSIVAWRHAIVRSELVDLDLAELADVTDAFTLESVEVRGDSAVLQVYDTREGLVEQRSNALDGKVACFRLLQDKY